MEILLQGIFDSSAQTTIRMGEFLLCIGVSLIIGIFLAAVYTYKSRYTQSFVTTLAMLPAVVCVVIMMVNGNLGAGVAVAGAFSLVRFRSVPGTAKEIGAIFLAMGTGLITGMGYLGYGVLFALILGLMMLLFTRLGLGGKNASENNKTLQIIIPENLDYNGVFDEIMEKYTVKSELRSVKTTNMGSLFKLTYDITMKDAGSEKEFIDKLRCRNGNLEISIHKKETAMMEL